MKKLLLFGLLILLMFCVVPVGAYRAVDDIVTVINAPMWGMPIPIFNVDVLQNDDYYTADPSLFPYPEVIENPQYGSIECGRLGCAYKGSPSYFGPVQFKYRITDGHSYSNNATVYLNVVPYGWAFSSCVPIARFNTAPNTQLSVDDNSYLGCYDDPRFGGGHSVSFPSNPSNGKLKMRNCPNTGDQYKGCFDYIPNPNFSGWDLFTVQPWFDSGYWGDVPGKVVEVAIYIGEPPYPSPEFPSILLPVTMIIGFLGAVLYIRRTREH